MDKSQIDPPNNLRYYLNQLKTNELLSSDRETRLLNQIAIHRDRLASRCSRFIFFRKELVSLLDRKVKRDKGSRPIQTGLKAYPAEFNEFLNRIDTVKKGLLSKEWQDSFVELELSGNFFTALVTNLSVKWEKFKYLEKLEKLRVYFNAATVEHLFPLLEACLLRPELRGELLELLETTAPEVHLKLQELRVLQQEASKYAEITLHPEFVQEFPIIMDFFEDFYGATQKFKDEIITKNLRLVVSRARTFVGRGFSFESLVQEGNIGLIKAVDKYSPKHNVKLSTYATWWIDQTIQRAIANKSKVIRIPTHIQTLQLHLKDAVKELTDAQGKEPNKAALAVKLNVKESMVDMLQNVAQFPTELETELKDGTVIQHAFGIEDPLCNPFHITAQNMLHEKVHEMLAKLPPKYEQILRLKFGIGVPNHFRNNKEIAENLNIARPSVRNRVEKATLLALNEVVIGDFE